MCFRLAQRAKSKRSFSGACESKFLARFPGQPSPSKILLGTAPCIRRKRALQRDIRLGHGNGVSPVPLKEQVAANRTCQAATKAGRQCAAPVVRRGNYWLLTVANRWPARQECRFRPESMAVGRPAKIAPPHSTPTQLPQPPSTTDSFLNRQTDWTRESNRRVFRRLCLRPKRDMCRLGADSDRGFESAQLRIRSALSMDYGFSLPIRYAHPTTRPHPLALQSRGLFVKCGGGIVLVSGGHTTPSPTLILLPNGPTMLRCY